MANSQHSPLSRDSTDHENISPGQWADVRVLIVEGATAADFLQGYLTCDTAKMTTGTAQPAAICTIKGRVLANGWAIPQPAAVGLIVHESMFATVQKFLTPYANFSKCTLNPEPAFIEINTPAADICLFTHINVGVSKVSPDTLPDQSAAMQRCLIQTHYALISSPVSEQFLPQMLGLDSVGAVDFEKGCYLGQEIVARAQFRGEVKRRITSFTWTDNPPPIGATTENRDTIISVADNGQGLKVARVDG